MKLIAALTAACLLFGSTGLVFGAAIAGPEAIADREDA
jgi:hypothetical protein